MARAQGLEEQGRPFLVDTLDERPTEFLFDVGLMARMDELGLFGSVAERIELRKGKLIVMAPVGLEHALSTPKVVRQLWRLIEAVDPGLAVLQGTVTLTEREAPIPDAAVVRGDPSGPYVDRSQALLVVEVSKSTLQDDLTDKRDSYAEAGIPEYWVLDVVGRRLHVFRTPVEGVYADCDLLEQEGRISPLFAQGGADVAVADLL